MENEIENFVMRALANASEYSADGWITFEQLDRLMAKEKKDWSEAVRRSYLRGAVGNLLRSGQAVRDKFTPKYKISEETLQLFA